MSDLPQSSRRESTPASSEDGQDRRRKNKDASRDQDSSRSHRRRDRERPSDDESSSRHHQHRHRSRRDRSSDNLRRRRDNSREEEYSKSRRRDRSRAGKDDSRRHRDRPRSRERHRSRSPPTKRRRQSASLSRSPIQRSRKPLPSQDASFRGDGSEPKRLEGAPDAPPPEKQKPNYKPTGLLAKEANTVTGTTTVLKYHEPPEARKPPPKDQWRLYVFKGKDLLDTIHLHSRSVWLCGRDRTVTDLLLEHPSITKQHAVIQFRYITTANEFGDRSGKVKPYLIDLESVNGTKLNGARIEASRFVELVDGDVVKFGESEREYVLMLPPPG